jgi:two-component system, OmpR family, alkaline phosphatase synthesis response regulator PhoP
MNREETMPGSILVVDDEQNLRHTLAFILKRAGYYVTTTENAEETLNTLQTGTFDLMILDIKMPDVDGLTLLKVIRQNHPKLPVFILTGYGSLDSAIQALQLEARDYLLKPIDPAQLLERIHTILQEEQSNQRRNEILNQVHTLIAELDEIKGEESAMASQHPLVNPPETARYLRRGVFYIDIKARYVELAGQSISLPPSTFSYLLTLLRHSPDPVNYQDLVAESQGKSLPDAEARSLARWQIYQLRLAIEAEPEHPRFIVTVRNFGYRLIAENPTAPDRDV